MFKWEKRDSNAPSERADFIVCWIKDLLDERAKQTKGCLKDEKGRCCLGVACDTAKLKWSKDDGTKKSYNIKYGKNDQYSESNNLPEPLQKFLKCGDNGYFKGAIEFRDVLGNDFALTDLNDEYLLTFREIAKVIQKYCESLFNNLSKKEIKFIKDYKIPTRQELRNLRKAAD